MTSAQVVETSVKVITNSPSQDYTHPDDHNLRTYDYNTRFSNNISVTYHYQSAQWDSIALFVMR